MRLASNAHVGQQKRLSVASEAFGLVEAVTWTTCPQMWYLDAMNTIEEQAILAFQQLPPEPRRELAKLVLDRALPTIE